MFEEVPYTGQSLMSTRWVITEKETDGSSKLKARLVVRGYEEKTDLKSDSPTVHKESLQIFLAITSTCIYDIHSIDSFDVYVGFTREEYRRGYIYKTTGEQNKCVYGLVDASRNWFLSVKKELLQLLYLIKA